MAAREGGGEGGHLETQELSEEHFPWKILPTSVKLICCDGHLEGFRFFLNCGCLKSGHPDNYQLKKIRQDTCREVGR